jgi:hypothetical protein
MAFGLSESIIEHEDDLKEIACIFDEFLGQAQLCMNSIVFSGSIANLDSSTFPITGSTHTNPTRLRSL